MKRLVLILRILVLFSLAFRWWSVDPAYGNPSPGLPPGDSPSQIYLSGDGADLYQAGADLSSAFLAGSLQAGKTSGGISDPQSRQRMLVLFDTPEEIGPESSPIRVDTLAEQALDAGAAGGLNPVFGAGGIEIVAEMKGLLKGAVVMLTPAEIEQLRHLPGVKDIVVDQLLQVALDGSLASLHAPEVWELGDPQGHPVIGSGIRVAVIDTGIDFGHPALGGCFGEGCRVVGGWDFVNNDPDPLDDNGHGTHVAGIIASNDTTYRGVAPGVTLLAYKACGQDGACYASHVISAIDRAIQEGAQIINISLTGNGSADSPLSTVVNRAVEMGVSVVVPAGNAGSTEGYRIGSPGNAEKAITVGAAYKSGQMAYFSARGGVWEEYFKPDLAAPGVGIRSTYPGGQFATKDGTSMAAPHVAGAAALLLQLNPSWTPLQIKSSLMQTAALMQEGSYDAFIEGSGFVQPQRAAAAKISIEPNYLVGRLSSAPAPSQVFIRSLTIKNSAAGARSYLLEHLPQDGVVVKFTPSRLTLTEGASAAVQVEFTIENASLPDGFNTSGCIILRNSTDLQDEYHIPYGLTRYVSAAFEFDETPFVVIVQERSPGSWRGSYFPGERNFSIDLLQPGNYDFVFIYPSQSHFVIRAGVRLDSSQSFIVHKSEAKNMVRLGYRDADGLHLLMPDQIHMLSDALIYRGEPLYASSRGSAAGSTDYYFSDFPTGEYPFNLSVLAKLGPEDEYYDFSYSILNITGNVNLANDIRSFNRLETPFSPRADREAYSVVYSMTLNASSRLTFRQTLEDITPDSSLVVHLDPHINVLDSAIPIFNLRRVSLCTTITCYDEDFRSTRFYETPYLRSEEDRIDVLAVEAQDEGYPHDFVKINEINDGPHRINYNSSFWNGKFANRAYRAELNYAVSGYDWETPYLRDWAGNMLVAPIEYRVFSGGDLWASGNLWDELSNTATRLTGWGIQLPENGATRIEMSYPDPSSAARTQNTVTAEFDTSRPDPDPPTLQALLFCQNEAAHVEQGTLVYLYIEDGGGIHKVEFSILREGGWQPLPAAWANANIYRVKVSSASQTEALPVRITAVDGSGNRITQQTSLPSSPIRACPELLLGKELAPHIFYLPTIS